ncbi:MAG: transcriptional repressor LexA [Gemmatimonadetes bacterium]|nr:transcriptional repressor LexA [Gemmatimonadota bacterium]
MPDQLTELERRVLDYLVEYLRTNTYQPSIREIGREFSIKSTKTVSELLQALARKGWIERDPSRSRGVRLIGIEMRDQPVSMPVFDSAEATTASDHIQIDRKIVTAHGAYLLSMSGNHLTEVGVRPGDLLVIEPVEPAALESGDIVLAHTAGTTSVRRCARNGTEFSIDPLRRGEAAVRLTQRQAGSVIRGRVTGLIRRMRPAVAAEPAAAVPLPAN